MTQASSIVPDGRPFVSVVIPCYNYGHYLPGTVRSALDQPGVRVEVIIVDDASTDDSARVAQRIVDRDQRARLVRHDVNRGHIATYNEGLGLATGEYVVLLSADDLLAPGSLGRACALMLARPDIGLVYGYAPEFSESAPPLSTARTRWSSWDGDGWLRRMCRRGTNIIVNPEAVMRRRLLEDIGGYSAQLPQTADMALWMSAAARMNVGRVNGPQQGFYRVHDANMHLTAFRGLLTDMRARRMTFEWFFARDGRMLPDADELLETARRSIAVDAVRLARSLRAVRGTDVDVPDPAEIAEFARDTWPAIVRTAVWRRYGHRSLHGAGPIVSCLETRTTDVRAAIRWRRWRRFGT